MKDLRSHNIQLMKVNGLHIRDNKAEELCNSPSAEWMAELNFAIRLVHPDEFCGVRNVYKLDSFAKST